MSEEQKIIDLENEISFLKNALYEQQKEIEELKVCLQAEKKYAEGLNNDIKSLLNIEPNNNFIEKDKIREKIKEIEENEKGFEYSDRDVIKILEELLEE